MSDDFYTTIAHAAEIETKVLGSRFIGRAWPVASEAEVQDILAERRRVEYTATHHCSAFRLGPDAAQFRYHDDGEPSGTAGAPILRQIEGRDLTDTLVVVTRYYGGTKLGTGGLIRAYGEAAALALDAAGRTEHTRRTHLVVAFDYADTSPALHTLGRFDTLTVNTRYGEHTEMDVAVRTSQADALAEAFVEALSGRGRVQRDD